MRFLNKISPEDTDYHLSIEAADTLKSYSFPGNVRELENILERAVTLCDDQLIQATDLSIHEPISQTADNLYIETPSVQPPTNKIVPPLKDEQQLRQALEETRWNRKAAAELLGVTYRQLRYKLKKMGLD